MEKIDFSSIFVWCVLTILIICCLSIRSDVKSINNKLDTIQTILINEAKNG